MKARNGFIGNDRKTRAGHNGGDFRSRSLKHPPTDLDVVTARAKIDPDDLLVPAQQCFCHYRVYHAVTLLNSAH